jgi:hypothetical protein
MKIAHAMFLGLVVLIAASQTGCARAPKTVGEEKSSMLKGTQTVLKSDPVTITNAAKAVVDDMKLTVEKNVSTVLDGKLIARSANRMKLVVATKAYGESTLVTVRAGGFGDRALQKQVLDRIKAKLPAVAYTPPPQPSKPAAKAAPLSSNRAQQPAAPGQATTDNAQLPF